MNFDGASFGNPGLTGYGCILHDHDGAIKGVKAAPIGRTYANQEELTGMLESLRMLKIRNIIDCMVERGILKLSLVGKWEKMWVLEDCAIFYMKFRL